MLTNVRLTLLFAIVAERLRHFWNQLSFLEDLHINTHTMLLDYNGYFETISNYCFTLRVCVNWVTTSLINTDCISPGELKVLPVVWNFLFAAALWLMRLQDFKVTVKTIYIN